MVKRAFTFPPAVIALCLQLVAFISVLLSARAFAFKLSFIVLACVCGLVAATLSYFAKQANWWLIIQLLFAPALVGMLALKLDPLFFLAGFLAMLVVYWNTYSTQVPLYLSSQKVWQALEGLLPLPDPDKRFTFVDIGSGLGGVLAHLAKIRTDGDYTGIESAPLPFLWSWLRLRLGAYRHCQVQWVDFWHCDLSRYDVVFAYLSPAPMAQLWQKAKTEMRPGSVFISSTFTVPGQKPAEIITTDDRHHSSLLIWRM